MDRVCSTLILIMLAGTAAAYVDYSNSLLFIENSYLSEYFGPKNIYMYNLTTRVFQPLPVTDMKNPVALGADVGANYIFWTDVSYKTINRATLTGRDQEIIKLLPGGSTPDGLAVDDKRQLLFYTDTGRNIIACIDYEGQNERIIIDRGLDEPRAIVLHKSRRVMYWTDWGEPAKIMTASYYGFYNRSVVQKTNLVWPNGLALDTESDTLYWCDGYLGRVESISTDGTNRKLLNTHHGFHYFGIALHHSSMYLTTWNKTCLFKHRLPVWRPNLESNLCSHFSSLYGIVSLGQVQVAGLNNEFTTWAMKTLPTNITLPTIASTTDANDVKGDEYDQRYAIENSSCNDVGYVALVGYSVGATLVLFSLLIFFCIYCNRKRQQPSQQAYNIYSIKGVENQGYEGFDKTKMYNMTDADQTAMSCKVDKEITP